MNMRHVFRLSNLTCFFAEGYTYESLWIAFHNNFE